LPVPFQLNHARKKTNPSIEDLESEDSGWLHANLHYQNLPIPEGPKSDTLRGKVSERRMFEFAVSDRYILEHLEGQMAAAKCNFDYVELWKKLGRYRSQRPQKLESWLWFRQHVLNIGELREKFKLEGLDSFMVP
jgi:hypothetical protein